MQFTVETGGLRASAAAVEEALARLERVRVADDLAPTGSAFRGGQTAALTGQVCAGWGRDWPRCAGRCARPARPSRWRRPDTTPSRRWRGVPWAHRARRRRRDRSDGRRRAGGAARRCSRPWPGGSRTTGSRSWRSWRSCCAAGRWPSRDRAPAASATSRWSGPGGDGGRRTGSPASLMSSPASQAISGVCCQALSHAALRLRAAVDLLERARARAHERGAQVAETGSIVAAAARPHAATRCSTATRRAPTR